MAGSTISTTVTVGVTLGSSAYRSPLIITAAGDIAPIAAGANALLVAYSAGYVLNHGRITGAIGATGTVAPLGVGVSGGGGGLGVNLVAGSLTNAGTIIGGIGGTGGSGNVVGGEGGTGGSGVDVAAGRLINQATIIGGAGGAAGAGALVLAKGAGGVGVLFNAGGTFTDSGFVAGGSGASSGDAVYFGSGASRLVLDPGASFGDAVVANTAFSNVLELASAATAGTLSGGIGAEYNGFKSVTVDAGATWTLTAANTVAGGASLGVAAGAFLRVQGNLTIDGTLANSGTVAGRAGISNSSYYPTGPLNGHGVPGSDAGSAVDLASGSLVNMGAVSGGGGGSGGNGTALGGAGGQAGAGGTAVVGMAGSLTNAGTIAGGYGGAGGSGGIDGGFAGNGGDGGAGVVLTSANVSNTGRIAGGAGGNAGGGLRRVSNYGFAGTGGAGVDLTSGGVTNSGTIIGGAGGIDSQTGGTGGIGVLFAGGGTLTNAGFIGGGGGAGGIADAVVFGTGTSRLIVDPDARFSGAVVANAAFANQLELAGGAGTETLSGAIGSEYQGFAGVTVDAGATWNLTNVGTLIAAGGTKGANGPGGPGGSGNAAAEIGDGTLVNNGAITGGSGGYGGIGLEEAGPGGAGGDAVDIAGGGLTNAGAITGGSGGYGGQSAEMGGGNGGRGGNGVNVITGSLTNTGTITGGGGGHYGQGTFPGTPGNGGTGVLFHGGGTLVDAGLISGGTGAGSGDAVYFGSGTSRLVLDPGASFSGAVVANAAFSNVLELASAATAGTLSGGIGVEYNGFKTVIVDSGATWTLTAANTVADGTSLGVAAGAFLRVQGDLTVDGTLANSGAVAGRAGISNSGYYPTGPFNGHGVPGSDAGSAVDLASGSLVNMGAVSGGGGGSGGNGTALGGAGGQAGAGGTAVVGMAGSLTNAGTIAGGYGGAGGSGGIDGGFAGNGGDGGAGVVLTSANVSNTGRIAGGAGGNAGGGLRRVSNYGFAGTGGAGVDLTSGGVTNSGTIIGGAGGIDSQTGGTGGIGVLFAGGGTLTNAGFIGGGGGAGGIADAVVFGTGTSRLILDPGAAFGGAVIADASYANVLELATGSGAGTLGGGIGTEYLGFGNIIVDAGATWTLTSANTLGSGDSIVVDGSLTNLGAIVGGNGGADGVGGAGVYGAASNVTNLGTITGGDGGRAADGGDGVLFVGGGTLSDRGVITGGIGVGGVADAVVFSGGAARLILAPGASFNGGVVADAAYGNLLELASSASTGTLSGLGSAFQGFGSIVVDPGANWTLSGVNEIATGTILLGTGDTLAVSGDGVVVVNGTGALLSNTGELLVGDAAAGELSIDSGGTVISSPGMVAGTPAAVIANQSGAGGSAVNVTGAGSDWQVGGALAVGNAATGVLAITDGASVSATTLDVGVGASGAGIVTVSGPDADLTTTGAVSVGDAGSGELSILDGANANIGGDLNVANAGTGTGNVDIEDTTGTITFGGNILVGFNGFGVFNVGFNVDYIQNNGGIIFGPDSSGAINSFADPSPFLSNSSPSPISIGAQGVDQLAAYLFNSGEFTIPNNHSLTFETPIISGGGSFALGSGDSLVLNADTVTGQTFTLGSNDKLTIGIDNLTTIDLPATGTGPFTPEGNPNKGDLLLGNFGGVIANFSPGDTIDVDTYLSSASAGTLSQNGSVVSVIEIANGATLGVLRFDTVANATAAIADDAITLVPCFAAGTRISTARGEVAVEAIGVGDRVRVLLGGGPAGGGFSEVIWVGRREVDCANHAQPRKVWPVRIAAGAFGPGQPHADVWLSPDHAIYFDDVLIPIKHLINGTTIAQVKVDRITYHHIELAEHDVLLAEGLPAESFLDLRDATNYANRPGPARLYPDYSARMWEAFGCARLVVTGPELAAAQASVTGFASEQQAS